MQPEEGDNKVIARGYSFFRMDKQDVRVGGGTLIQVADNYDSQEKCSLNAPNMQALRADITTKGSSISVVGFYRSPGSTPVGQEELVLFPIVVEGSAGKLLIAGNFNALEIDWAFEATPGDNCGHQILRFVHANGIFQQVTRAKR